MDGHANSGVTVLLQMPIFSRHQAIPWEGLLVYPSVYPSISPSVLLSIQISFHPSSRPSVHPGNFPVVSKALHLSWSSQSPPQGILLAHRWAPDRLLLFIVVLLVPKRVYSVHVHSLVGLFISVYLLIHLFCLMAVHPSICLSVRPGFRLSVRLSNSQKKY